MQLILTKTFIGLTVGILVGMTGIGGGLLLVPLLIFGLGVSPIIAVGSDAVFNAFTKLGSGILHWRQGTVNWHLVAALISGSVPGAFAGVGLLAHLRTTYGNGVNEFIKLATGVLLLIVPILFLLQGQLRQHDFKAPSPEKKFRWGVAAIGLVAGFLVGATSIGSGSVTVLLLMLMYPDIPLIVVGTDIVHAVFLTGVVSILHFHIGTVDAPLVAALLLGSIPGGLLGARLSAYVPTHWLKRVLCGVLLVTGARMLV